MSVGLALLYLLIFPGFLFLFFYSFFCEYFDRKMYARMQNRVGPPPYQPFADFVKLLSKQSIVPKASIWGTFSAAPIFGLAGALSAIFYIPIWGGEAAFSFQGDLIAVLFLLAIASFSVIFGGWFSANLFGQVGGIRTATQIFGYEIPFFLACLAPALFAGTWSISEILGVLSSNWACLALFVLGLAIAIVSLEAKLERIPFDIPEAETEIVAGPMVEFSGRRLAFFRLMLDVEMVVGAALISALFLGGPYLFPAVGGPASYVLGFISFLIKTLFVVFLLSLIRVLFARVRIEQMVSICYKWLIPLSIVQFLIIMTVMTASGVKWAFI